MKICLKNNLQWIVILSISACLIRCTPEPIPIYLEPGASKPVIWSQAIPANTTLIYLSRSFGALEFQEGDSTSIEDLLQQFLAENGLVTLTHNGSIDTLFKVSDGFWATFDTELIVGDTYTLNALDFYSNQSVTAQATMYAPVEPDTVYYQSIDTATVDITIQFHDPAGPNWYAIHFYSSYSDPLATDDPFVAENVVETKLLSDLELSGSLASVTSRLEYLESDTVYVSLNNISPEYYDYLSQRQRGGNIYNQLVQEPINYVSNVQGGYGMFSLHVPVVRQLVME